MTDLRASAQVTKASERLFAAAQRVLPGNDVPVGVVTAALGGIYLTWLLARQGAKR